MTHVLVESGMPVTASVQGRYPARVGRDGGRPRGRGHQPIMTAAAHLPSLLTEGDVVITGHGGGWPRRSMSAVATGSTRPITVMHNRIDDDLPYAVDLDGPLVRHRALMAARQTRQQLRTGAMDFVPNSYGRVPSMIRSGRMGCDVVLLHLAPPDAHGWCSFGVCSAYLPAAAERARLVVAQINEQMPATGGTAVHITDLDRVISVDDPLYVVDSPRPDPVTTAIAGQVASLIEPGDTLQVGIGRLGEAVIAALSGHSKLSMWTETFPATALNLLAAGVLTGVDDRPPIVATFVTGSAELYRELASTDAVQFLPVDQTNAPSRLATIPRLVAVNAAIEVDLSGQINAESIGPMLYSGSGGHLDFATGAWASPGGRYLCALPSRAGSTARIVAQFGAGTAVTIPRSIAGTVVTEYGHADLTGRSLAERAAALIAIAHPDDRESLSRAASELLSRGRS